MNSNLVPRAIITEQGWFHGFATALPGLQLDSFFRSEYSNVPRASSVLIPPSVHSQESPS